MTSSNKPKKGTFHAQVRGRGCSPWMPVEGQGPCKKTVVTAAIAAMIDGNHKRARVMFSSGSYGPVVVMEASQA